METNTSYNLDFLNNYFTSNEFDFINNANLENEKLDEIVSKELHNRDIIVNFINNLHNLISDSNNNESNTDFLNLLSEVQDIFGKINNNIQVVQELKNDSSQILDDIVKLLIKLEESPDNKENYFDQIQKLKDMINDFSVKSNDVKSKVLLNDIKIETFFQKNIVKKYLASFNTEFNLKDINNNLKHEINSKSNGITKEDSTLNKENNNTIDEKTFEDNDTLLISEKLKKVFLPFSKHEILLYLEQYPDSYKSYEDVINKEFVLSLDYYMKHPVVARFREAYSLVRDRESKSVLDAFKFAVDIMFHYSLNPIIIAACKTKEQLEDYMDCLEKNKLDEFKDFKIKFEVNPLV